MSDKYIVSARKYRPSTFRSVVGQQSLTHTLKTAIASGRLAHAYLFCGPRGVGKTTCARIFAKTINCEHPTPDGEACNECPSCKAFNEQRSYNINELDGASNNSVDNIRDLTDQVRIPPQTGRYRVIIIDEYVDAATFEMLDVRAKGVTADIYSSGLNATARDAHNNTAGVEPIQTHKWKNASHDRWLIVDDSLYHCGHSLKDTGKKLSCIDVITSISADVVLNYVR